MKQMNIFKITLLMIATFLTIGQVQAETNAKRVLMIVSGNGHSLEEGEKEGHERPGYEFDEFSKAYYVFKKNGVLVDIASPKGGKVQADKYDPKKSYNLRVLNDKAIMAKLNNTIATNKIDANVYDGVFVVGGKGAMFDLPKDKALQNVIAHIYHQNGSVAAVCHGPAALVNVKLEDGRYLVADKVVNSFTNEEEHLFGKKWLDDFDFMLENKLIERGAKFQSSQIMLSHVAVDGRLITGQNPTSTVDVATALVKSLGLSPVKLSLELEDKTMAMVAQYLLGDQTALKVMISNHDQYHIPLVGMYGFYFLKIAETTLDFEQSLSLMQLAQKAINNLNLDMKIAKTQVKLGQVSNAKVTLNNLISAKPNYKPAQEMLKTL